MADFEPKVTFIRIDFEDSSQGTYLMVQMKSFPEAQCIAKVWAKKKRDKTVSELFWMCRQYSVQLFRLKGTV